MADQHTGAMVALVPSVQDAARLAVPAGEPAGELHVTLAYLGEAASVPEAARRYIVDSVADLARQGGPIGADGFAVSMFNPPGPGRSDGVQREPCIVLGVSGHALAVARERVHEMFLGEPLGFDLPAQHEPWIPHVTLVYSGDVSLLAELVDRVGPVTFDRLRVAFAGVHTDFTLSGSSVERFNPAQPRNPDGQWTDALGDARVAPACSALSVLRAARTRDQRQRRGALLLMMLAREAGWDPLAHPRDARGKFIRKGLLSAPSIKGTLANLRDVSDDDLLDVFARISHRSRLDARSRRQLKDLDAELARREGAAGDVDEPETPEQARVDNLVGRGWSYAEAYAEVHGGDVARAGRDQRTQLADINRRPGESREQALRRMYAEVTYLNYLQAERWTRGNLLSREARARGVDPVGLFSGQRTRARRYASEELKRFWAEVAPRQTYAEWRAAMVGDAAERRRVQVSALAGSGRDFGL